MKLKRAICLILAVALLFTNTEVSFAMEDTKPSIKVMVKDVESFNEDKFGKAIWDIEVTDTDGLESIEVRSGSEVLKKLELKDKPKEYSFTYEMTKEEYLKSKLDNGYLSLEVCAFNINKSKAVETKFFKIDLACKKPVIEKLDKSRYKEFPSFTVTGTDENLKDVKVRIEGEGLSKEVSHQSMVSVQGGKVKDGIYIVEITSTDLADNVYREIRKITIDNEPPGILDFKVEGTKNTNNFYKNATIYFKIGEIEDGSTYILKDVSRSKERVIDQGDFSKGEFEKRIKFLETNGGVQNLELIVKDNLGNERTERLSFLMDSKVPKIEKISHSLGRFTKMPDIKVDIEDDTFLMNGCVTLTLKGKENIEITKVNEKNPVFTFKDLDKPLKDGKYDIEVKAIDASFNEAILMGEPIYIDTEKGEIKDFKVDGSLKDRYIKGDIDVSFNIPKKQNGFDMDKVECFLNNEKVYSKALGTSEKVSFKVTNETLLKLKKENILEFKIILKDKVEGLSDTEFTKTYIYDNVSPKVNIEGARSLDILNKPPKVKITALDDNLDYIIYKITCDGEEVKSQKVNKDRIELDDFNKTGCYQIKYKAVDLSENESDLKTLDFTVDLEKASIDAKLENQGNINNWYSKKVDFKGSFKDNLGLKKYSIYINDNLIESKNIEGKSFEINKTFESKDLSKFNNREGLYKIKVVVEDVAKNVTENVTDFFYDCENPEVRFYGAEDGDFLNEVKDFTLKVTDNVNHNNLCSLEYKIYRDGSLVYEKVENKEEVIINPKFFKEDGEYKVVAKAIDAAGNKTSISTFFTIDKSLAKINLNLSNNKNENGWYKSDVALTGTIKDNSYLDNYEILLNGKSLYKSKINGKSQNIDLVFTKEELLKIENEEGSYKVKVNAMDKAKNKVTKELFFNADFKNPSLNIENRDEGKTVNYVPDIKIENLDDHLNEFSIVYYKVYKDKELVSERKVKKVTYTLDKEIFKDEGRYIVKVKTMDAASNSSKEYETQFTLDKSTPEIGDITFIGSKSKFDWFNDDLKAKFNIKDNYNIKEFRFSINGKELEYQKNIKEKDFEILINKDDILDVKKVDGSYTVKIELIDDAGNKETKESVFYADFKAPVLKYVGIENMEYLKNPKDINLHIEDEHSKNPGSKLDVKVYRDSKKIIDETVFGKGDYKLDKAKISESGIYKITALAKDAAENKSNLVSKTFVIDNIPPKITDIKCNGHLSKKNWFNSKVALEFKVEDNMENLANISVTTNEKKIFEKSFDKADKVKYKSYVVTLSKSEIRKILNADGTLNFKIKANDFTDNKIEKNKRIYVDYVAPKLEITGVKKGEHYNKAPKITIKSDELFVNDSYMEYEILRDNLKVKNGTIKSKNIYNLNSNYFEKEGDYLVYLHGTDGADNKAQSKKTKFTIDKNGVKLSFSGVHPNIYSNKGETLTISAFERYFKDANIDILIEKTKGNSKVTSKLPFKMIHEKDQKNIRFTSTGTYKVKAVAKDRVGHTSETQNLVFTVDIDPPKITKKMPSNISGYKDLVSPKFNIQDDYIDNIGVSVLRNGARVNLPYQKTNSAIAFSDFKKTKENDGKYDIEVTARDKSGNLVKDKGSFIVNRFGARFETQAPEKGFYQKLDKDIVVTAKTPSKIIDHDFKLTLDNENVDLGKASVSGSPGAYKISYIIPKDLVSKEGFYRLDANIKDSALNNVTLKDADKPIEFAIDKTKPTVITNLNEDIYKQESKKVEIDVKDNLALKNIKIYKDNKLVLEKLEKDLVSGSEKLDFMLNQGRNQNIKIIATDMAGNTEKYVKKVSIGENLLVIKPIHIGILLALVFGCGAGVFYFRRKRDEK